MSKFAEVVKEWGVKPEEIVAASQRIEVRSAEDNLVAIARRNAVKGGKKLVEAGLKKPRLGRGITVKAVEQAIAGAPQSRIVRGKLTRAMKQLAKLKKKKELAVNDLFGEAKRKKGEPPQKAKPGAKA
ncbi:MAG: hypothetical protein IT381_20470 [Deltaproteobacteria bacterium]|nr:hypothetical protein [Deltaproteobacteria bacterium]